MSQEVRSTKLESQRSEVWSLEAEVESLAYGVEELLMS